MSTEKIGRKTMFVKISGDLALRGDVIDWIGIQSKKKFLVICIGGGSQINEEFAKRGIAPNFGPLGRETHSFEERQLARDVLEQNQAHIQDLLADAGVKATVIIPVLDIGSVLCHINGDTYVETVYLGFDQLAVLTLKGRGKDKKKRFGHLSKIQIVEFSD